MAILVAFSFAALSQTGWNQVDSDLPSGKGVGQISLGMDDNSPAMLTGSTGALRVWGDIIGQLDAIPLKLDQPAEIERILVDNETGLPADGGCFFTTTLPVIKDSISEERAPCSSGTSGNAFKKIINLFKKDKAE